MANRGGYEMTKGLDTYESADDSFTTEWTVTRRGDEVVGDYTHRYSFTLNRPASDTWRHLKDFNLWMNDLEWNGVVGDAPEGSTIYFTLPEESHDWFNETYGADTGLEAKDFRKDLAVKRAVPEKLLVHEELSESKREIGAYYIFALNESDGTTTVNGLMTYALAWAPKENENDLRAGYETQARDVTDRWLKEYIPRLRRLVER
jgi:hypothetical protein